MIQIMSEVNNLKVQKEPKGASLHVLAAKPHMDALFQQGAKGHVLAQGPVHRPVLHHCLSALQDATQTLYRGEKKSLESYTVCSCEVGETETHLHG